MVDRFAFTIPEAAHAAMVSESTMRRHIKRGEIAIVRIGSRIVIRRAEIDRWLMANEHRGEAS